MRMQDFKEGKDCPLEGIELETVVVDGTLKTATLKDVKGNVVRFAVRWETLEMSKVAPPEKKKVFRLEGKVLGIDFKQDFDSDFLARNRREELIAGTKDEADCTLTIVPAEVVVE